MYYKYYVKLSKKNKKKKLFIKNFDEKIKSIC